MRVLAALLIISCGQSAPEIKTPNTQDACDLAVSCGLINDTAPCVACLEHLNPAVDVADIPPLDTIDCDTARAVFVITNLSECVDAKWYGPKDVP